MSVWVSVSSFRKRKTEANSKEWRSVSERFTPSSVAAACSSRSNDRQNRLRSASPQARFTRLPKGAWRTSCMPPDSSKNRSAITRRRVGTAPRTAFPAAR